jgi:sulfur-oxidizing protein SoxZ
METGYRPGTNGRIIPRNIIERFSARWNGEEVFAMTFSPAIAANPFVSFFTVARDSGKIDFLWTGDENFRVAESVSIVVT